MLNNRCRIRCIVFTVDLTFEFRHIALDPNYFRHMAQNLIGPSTSSIQILSGHRTNITFNYVARHLFSSRSLLLPAYQLETLHYRFLAKTAGTAKTQNLITFVNDYTHRPTAYLRFQQLLRLQNSEAEGLAHLPLVKEEFAQDGATSILLPCDHRSPSL